VSVDLIPYLFGAGGIPVWAGRGITLSTWIASQSVYYDTVVPTDAATDYFVDFDAGSDVNDGTTWAQAKATLDAAADLLDGAGGVIKVRGTYSTAAEITLTAAGVSGTPIEMWADALHGAVLNMTGQADGINLYGAYQSLNGFEVYGSTYTPITGHASYTDQQVRYCYTHDLVWPDNRGGNGAAHITLPGANSLTDSNLAVGSTPTAGDAALTQNHGLYTRGANSMIRNNLVVNIRGGSGIQVWSGTASNQDGLVVVNNTVLNVNNSCIVVEATNAVVANNIVGYADNGTGSGSQFGIRANNGTTGVITHNLFWQNQSLSLYSDDGGMTNDNPITADPGFVDYQADGSGDYHVAAAGAAYQAGSAAYEPTLDYFGNPRSALPAVGFAEVED